MKTVDAGAALLDERLPGWRDVVNVDTLDLSDCFECVLGQLFGDYGRGCRILGIENSAPRLGFSLWGRGRWSRLTDAWRAKVAA